VSYRGVPYRIDLVQCRRALVKRQIEGVWECMEDLADAIGVSRSTVSRFFSGRNTSLTVTRKILEALKLTFEVAATEMDRVDDEEGQAGNGSVLVPLPHQPQPGTALNLM
jgi:transcriptional regulator with XRE-family HTH domain